MINQKFYSGSHHNYTLSIMKLFFLLVGMVLVLEGMPYAAAPESMQEWLKKLSELEPSQLRVFGIIAMVCGLVICFVVQKSTLFG